MREIFLRRLGWVGSVLLLAGVLQSTAFADGKRYQRKAIAQSRFGEGERKALLQKAYQISGAVSEKVVGQERAARALQERLVQYLEGFGTRTKDPISLHLIGLPGVGKSSILDVLESLGFKALRIDAQKFLPGAGNSLSNVMWQIQRLSAENKPAIVLFDEIDKTPEIVRKNGSVEEVSQPLIGMMNELLTSGKIADSNSSTVINGSNIMMITAMNLAPGEIEEFSRSQLGSGKSFYEFTVEDFERFDKWVRSGPHATSILLSKLFRSNTVSRLVPNALVVKPLSLNDYRQVAKIAADDAIRSGTSGQNAEKHLSFTYDSTYLDFLQANTVYAPSGARDTVIKGNALTESLIRFGAKANGGDQRSRTQPRTIAARWDSASNRIMLKVTPRYLHRKEWLEGESFEFAVEYDLDSRSFLQPEIVDPKDPVLPKSKAKGTTKKPLTKKQIREARYPKRSDAVKGLAGRLDQFVRGQERATRAIEENIGMYMGRPGPVEKAPPMLIFAGFPGIGKSELVVKSAKDLSLPIVRINMQEYSNDGEGIVLRLLDDLDKQIKKARVVRPDGRFIFQVEELDKSFEMGSQGPVNRPAMMVIKDLLNDGVISRDFQSMNGGIFSYNVDVRFAFTFVTMNFAVDRFGFKADPRLTTIEDVLNAWRRLSSTPADVKSLLGSMFLPETVNRLLPHMMILKPLEQVDYEWIIQKQAQVAIDARLLDPKTKQNLGMIDISLSDEYKRYLYNECVIPSEGGRFTATCSKKKISEDVEFALGKLGGSRKFGTAPLEISLDFEFPSATVKIALKDKSPDAKGELVPLTTKSIVLAFPPIAITGAVSPQRLTVAAHEFGHAYSAVRLGRRFEYATAVSPQAGIGGYVKFKPAGQSAQSLLSHIYGLLASRAMERIMLSDHPRDRASFLDIEYTASNDILNATKSLWNLIYEFGFDPKSGVIERMGVEGPGRYASFSDLPADQVAALGRVLADMEDYLVEDFLEAHTLEWYRKRILEFARQGGISEEVFYKLIRHPFPGDNSYNLGQPSRIARIFGEDAVQVPQEVREAMAFKQGRKRLTAEQNLREASQAFVSFLNRQLHGSATKIEAALIPDSGQAVDPCARVFDPVK